MFIALDIYVAVYSPRCLNRNPRVALLLRSIATCGGSECRSSRNFPAIWLTRNWKSVWLWWHVPLKKGDIVILLSVLFIRNTSAIVGTVRLANQKAPQTKNLGTVYSLHHKLYTDWTGWFWSNYAMCRSIRCWYSWESNLELSPEHHLSRGEMFTEWTKSSNFVNDIPKPRRKFCDGRARVKIKVAGMSQGHFTVKSNFSRIWIKDQFRSTQVRF